MNNALETTIKPFRGNARYFLLLRISGLEKSQALQSMGLTEHAYDGWMRDDAFTAAYRQVDALNAEFKKEAITFLRRDNQLQAVLLEKKLLKKIEDEVDACTYEFSKTPLAKTVYEKLLNEVDFQPNVVSETWNDRRQFFLNQPRQEALPQASEVNSDDIYQANNSQTEQYEESIILQDSEQSIPQTES